VVTQLSALPKTPKDLPDPGRPLVPTKTVARWDTFLGDIASGLPLKDAMLKCYISRADIETMTGLPGGLEQQRWNDARLSGLKRSWNVFVFEDIFERIASGIPVMESIAAVRGYKDMTFFKLVVQDGDINAQYRKALEARALIMSEEIIPISDDQSRDVLETSKGPMPNNAAVQRDKLRVETRRGLMGAWHTKMFGEKKEQVNVQVNFNHAERLEEARTRATQRDKAVTKQQLDRVIDATFTEKPPAAVAPADTDWMDDKPTDAVWREEK
jgi:hypothetical protein